MPVFVVIPTNEEHALKQALDEAQGLGQLAWRELPRGEFLVSFKGTSVELSNLLGITDGAKGLAVIAAMSSYYGRASTDIWEWVKAHWEG